MEEAPASSGGEDVPTHTVLGPERASPTCIQKHWEPPWARGGARSRFEDIGSMGLQVATPLSG